jgi:hypothetical protein
MTALQKPIDFTRLEAAQSAKRAGKVSLFQKKAVGYLEIANGLAG